jgi:hypothetical protein
MSIVTKAPAGHEVCLAVWPDRSDAFDRIGAGRNHTQFGDASGSLLMGFRLYKADEKTIHSLYGTGGFNEAVTDIFIRAFISFKYSNSAGFIGHNIYYKPSNELERVVKVMQAWEKRADAKYLGGTETLDTMLRRLLAAAGVKRAVVITGTTSEYRTMSLEHAFQEFINPAIKEVQRRLEPAEVAA